LPLRRTGSDAGTIGSTFEVTFAGVGSGALCAFVTGVDVSVALCPVGESASVSREVDESAEELSVSDVL
jgi:hypothetical protein